MRLSESAVDGDKTPEPQTAEAEPWPRARNDENDDIEGIDRTDVALKQFEVVDKNIYVRSSSDVSKYDESLPCHCRYNPDRDERSQACGESSDCINRLVQMECNPLTCPCGSYCMNRRFQKRQYAKVRIIDAGRKGFGMQALEDLDTGRFVMEYMGEVVTAGEFRKRAGVYQAEGIQHHYFMSIGNNKVIDATRKGCIARYINHSCGPNCVLQKWMVGGAIRMGIFVERPIKRGEEITFDYKFERMADSEPQPCYCGSAECKGIIGVTKERTRKNAPSAAGSDEDVDNVMADIDEEIEDDTVTRHQRDDIRRRHAAFDDEEYGGGDHADRAEMGLSDSETGSDVDDEDENGYHLASRSSGFKRIRRRTKKTGLTSPEQVLKFVQIMHRSARQTRIIEILIGKLMETNDKRLLKSLIGLQGVVILRSWLQDYENDDVMVIKILQCIAHMPISTKNTIEETRLLEAIEPLCRYSDETIAAMAQDLIERWSELKRVFKIPKKSRKESSATGTPASETPSVSRRQSPSRIARQATPLANTSAQGLEGNFANERAGQQNWRNVAGVQQPRMRSESPSMREPYGGYQHPHPNAYGNPNPNRPYYNQTPYGGAGGAGGVTLRQHQYGRIHQGSRVPSASSGSVSGDKWTGGSHGLQGEYAATDSPAQNTPDTSTSVYSASKAKVDEIIERAQRLGVVNMQADKPGSKNAASSSDNAMGATTALQLVTPETDNEPTTGASKKQPYPHTTLHTAAPTGSTSSVANVPASNDSTSGLSPHNSPRKITPMSAAKREKLEKKATSELAAFVVRAMSKYKGQLDHDEFKHEARKITKILMEKERKTPPFDPLKLIELSQHKKTKIKQFVADYMNKLVSRRTDAGSPRDTPSEGAAVPKTPPIPPPSASALR
ncbi:hypothetical protein GGI07_002340 [Coemansia sp. Benny D115]|nr:hypothetical protein GGI07_002340 [Coemansia sp. Benny D115]